MRDLITLCTFIVLAMPPMQRALAANVDDYVVAALVAEDDPYFKAASELQRLRGGRIVRGEAGDLESLLEEFRRSTPRHVAIIVRPEILDENFVRKFLVMATKLDDDPFVDFAYGFITGESPDDSVALAGAGKRAEQGPRKAAVAMIGVAAGGLTESASSSQVLPLRNGSLPYDAHIIAADASTIATAGNEIDPAEDDSFIRDAIPKLADKSIVLFAGHGYPRRVVGGPTYQHLSRQRFDGALVMNIACYTGVTSRWFDNDWQRMKIRERSVPANESFCLEMLKTGVAGYVSYVSARPAGAAMFGDAVTIATEGQSIGELMRDNSNSVVLAHLQQGHDALHVTELTDGASIARDRTVRDTLIQMSTGGVLFGDPAFVPFKRKAGAHPFRLSVKRRNDSLTANVEIAGPLYHFFSGDQIVMWDEQTPSLRLEARVPLGNQHLAGVRLVKNTLGDVPYRLAAAEEQHDGKRFLHVKASFKQPEMAQMMQLAQDGVAGTFEIETSSTPGESSIVRREEAR